MASEDAEGRKTLAGSMLRAPLSLQKATAKEISVPQRRVGEIVVVGKHAITADTDLSCAHDSGLADGYWPRAQAYCDTQ